MLSWPAESIRPLPALHADLTAVRHRHRVGETAANPGAEALM